MSHKLDKPFTGKEKADFIVEYNHNKGLRIEETETAIYALEDFEKLEDNTVINVINDSNYLAKKQEEENNKIKSQIILIEAQQARALREILLNNNEYSRTKLEEIESQIQNLRSQLHV